MKLRGDSKGNCHLAANQNWTLGIKQVQFKVFLSASSVLHLNVCKSSGLLVTCLLTTWFVSRFPIKRSFFMFLCGLKYFYWRLNFFMNYIFIILTLCQWTQRLVDAVQCPLLPTEPHCSSDPTAHQLQGSVFSTIYLLCIIGNDGSQKSQTDQIFYFNYVKNQYI